MPRSWAMSLYALHAIRMLSVPPEVTFSLKEHKKEMVRFEWTEETWCYTIFRFLNNGLINEQMEDLFGIDQSNSPIVPSILFNSLQECIKNCLDE